MQAASQLPVTHLKKAFGAIHLPSEHHAEPMSLLATFLLIPLMSLIPLHHLVSLVALLAGDAYFLHGQDLALQSLQFASLPQSSPTPSPLSGGSTGHSGASPLEASDGDALAPAGASSLPALPASVVGEVDVRQASSQLQVVRWASAYYIPANADRLIVAFRQWLDKYAGTLWNLHHWQRLCVCSTASVRVLLSVALSSPLSYPLFHVHPC